MPLAVSDVSGTSATLSYVHTDHLGRPILMTDASGSTVFQATYKPYGEVYSTSATKALNLRFPGQYFQIETGFATNWHRHYDPITGRYTQPDPLRFVDGPSIYNYATASPLMKTDREGLSAAGVASQLGLNLSNSNPPNSSAGGSGGGAGVGAVCPVGEGEVFENREGRLPDRPLGYYTIRVGVGPVRFVFGLGGEIYYSPDHYKTFIPLN